MKKLSAFCLIAGGALGGLFYACSPSDNTGSNPPPADMAVAATYSVGGTLTGVMGTGLVLSLNGSEDLPVSADGAFTFSKKLAAGAQYAVTAKSSPAGQTCTVMSGSGTVASANVTSVSVVCSTNAFKVGGTVSGLNGNVVLQNNAGDDLTVSANGSFEFATRVAVGASYAVTVKTQPANQLCTVASGTGMIGSAAITSVAVTCATPTSCADILAKVPTAASGPYPISPDGAAPYQVWCDMTNDGGGWTLAMRVKNDTVFGYASAYWTDAQVLNEDNGGSVDPTLNANAKTMAFVNLPGTMIRGCNGAPGANKCFQQSLGGTKTLRAVFGENFKTGGPNRTTVVGLWGDDTTQANCNGSGINNYSAYAGPGTYSGARFGLVGNNENDCATTDSAWGFGLFSCSSMTISCGAGAAFWQSGTCGKNCTQGTLWVR